MRMSPSCGCCYCERCRILYDQFSIADTSTISGWSEQSGDWQVLSEELTTTADDAIVHSTAVNPYGYAGNVITVYVKGSDAGDQLDVLTGISGTTYVRVRLTLQNGSTCGTLSIDDMSGSGADNLTSVTVPNAVEDQWHKVKVCHWYDPSSYIWRIAAEVTVSNGTTVAADTANTSTNYNGDKVGLGTGTIGTRAYFDNFCWQRHLTSEIVSGNGPDTGCPSCGRTCLFSTGYIDTIGTDLGCAWEECSGSWSIEDSGSGVLAITTSATGTLRHVVSNPYSFPEVRLTLQVKFEDVGDRMQIMVAAGSCASSSGYGIELETESTCGILRIVDSGVQVGDDIGLAGFVPDQWHDVDICFGTGLVSNTSTVRRLVVKITPNGRDTIRHAAVNGTNAGSFVKIVAAAVTSKLWLRNWKQATTYLENLAENCDTCDNDIWCTWHIYDCVTYDACVWNPVSGSWTCLATSSDDALKRFEWQQPHATNRMRMLGTVTMSGSGTAIAYIAYKDATEYMALRITTGGTCPTVELVEDGVVLRSVEDHRIVADAAIDFCVMYDGSELSAWYLLPGLGFEHIYLESPATGHTSGGLVTGLKAAVGTGTVTTGSVTFTDVSLYVAKSATNTACEDCDKCYVWFAAETLADGPAFNGTAGASLPCEYGGTAVYGSLVGELAAKVPAGGTMSFDVGLDDASTIAYVTFLIPSRPAVLTVTSCGIPAVLDIASDGTAELSVNGGTATTLDSVIAIETVYTLKLCSLGSSSRAILQGGPWGSPDFSMGHADGTGTVNGSTVTIGATSADVYVTDAVVTRHYKNNGTSKCGECIPYCAGCVSGNVPAQFLVVFSGCSGSFFPDVGCCSINGAYYVPMDGCTGTLEWTDDDGDKAITVEITVSGGNTTITVTWEHYESGFGGALIASGEWGRTFTGTADCLNLSSVLLSTDPGVISSPDSDCADALAATVGYLSAV